MYVTKPTFQANRLVIFVHGETKDILRSFGKFVTNCVMVKKFSQLFHLQINFVLVSGLEFSPLMLLYFSAADVFWLFLINFPLALRRKSCESSFLNFAHADTMVLSFFQLVCLLNSFLVLCISNSRFICTEGHCKVTPPVMRDGSDRAIFSLEPSPLVASATLEASLPST